MATVVDLIEGARLLEDESGVSTVRNYIVDNLTGDAVNRLNDALTAPDIPARGESHPTIEGIQVDTKAVEMIDRTKANVTVTYKRLTTQQQDPDAEPVMQIRSGTVNTIVNKDVDGFAIILTYKPMVPIVDKPGETTEGDKVNQPGEANKLVPATIIRFERKESENPLVKSLKNVGKVNSISFQGLSARRLLCTSIDGTSNDGGATYNVAYEFQYDSDGWDPDIVFHDPATGKPATDPEPTLDNGGIVSPKIYEEIDFNKLNLGNL